MCPCVCVCVKNFDKLSHFQLHNNIIDGTFNMVEMWCETYNGDPTRMKGAKCPEILVVI